MKKQHGKGMGKGSARVLALCTAFALAGAGCAGRNPSVSQTAGEETGVSSGQEAAERETGQPGSGSETGQASSGQEAAEHEEGRPGTGETGERPAGGETLPPEDPEDAESAGPTVYVANSGDDDADGITPETALKTLYAAVEAVPFGGRIVVCGPLSIKAALELPENEGLIVITSVAAGEDYRVSAGGKASMVLGGNLQLRGPVAFENLDLVAGVSGIAIICNGNYLSMGEGITTKVMGVTGLEIFGGSFGGHDSGGAYVEIDSGNWQSLKGGARSSTSASQSGDVFLTIRGGTFSDPVILGGDTPLIGNGHMRIYGGTFEKGVYGTGAADLEGSVGISVYGGNFSSDLLVSGGGALKGNCSLNVFTSPDVPMLNDAGGAEGDISIRLLEGEMADFSGLDYETMDSSASEEAMEKEEKLFEEARARLLPDAEGPGSRDFTSAKNPMAGQNTGSPDLQFAYYGKAEADGGQLISGLAFTETGRDPVTISAKGKLQPGTEEKAGLYFGCDLTSGPAGMDGYYFEVDAYRETASLYSIRKGVYMRHAMRSVELFGGAESGGSAEAGDGSAELRVVYRGNAADLYLLANSLDDDPYPIFNLQLEPRGSWTGQYVEGTSFGLPEITDADDAPEAVYTNRLLEPFTDPEILFVDGRYYIYGTNDSTARKGIQCYSTVDFKVFEDEGFVLKNGDTFGDSTFRAANVVYHDGLYYMFYMAKSVALNAHVTACAASPSPTGPFTNPEKTPLTGERNVIGGQPFVDRDGTVYLTFVRTGGGNHLYGAKVELKDGKAKIDLDSAKLLADPTEEWENAKAPVAECGYIMRHGDLYYLLYSGGDYDSTYGTGYAISEDPLGPYVKYEKNPILKSNDQAFGVGAASVFTSPDGREHFIIYLENFSPSETRPLRTCIDRIKYVPDPSGGPDLLVIGGPTVTPQSLPSGMDKLSRADNPSRTNKSSGTDEPSGTDKSGEGIFTDIESYQESRFIW